MDSERSLSPVDDRRDDRDDRDVSDRAMIDDGTRVYVKNIPSRVSDSEFRGIFSPYGNVLSTRLLQGYGFISIENLDDAQRAIDALNGTDLFGHGEAVVVELSKPKDGGPRYRAVVLNINPNTSWQDLKDFGRDGGFEILFSVIDRDRENTGILEFASKEDLDRGIAELSGRELGGNTVTLDIDTKPPPPSRRGGRGGRFDRGGRGGRGRGPPSYRSDYRGRDRDYGRPYDRRGPPPRDSYRRGPPPGDRDRYRDRDRRDDYGGRHRYRSRSPRRDHPPPPPAVESGEPSW